MIAPVDLTHGLDDGDLLWDCHAVFAGLSLYLSGKTDMYPSLESAVAECDEMFKRLCVELEINH